jgi:hypothetical protein
MLASQDLPNREGQGIVQSQFFVTPGSDEQIRATIERDGIIIL